MRELRIIWASVVIKMRMRRKLKKHGSIDERFRSAIRYTFLFQIESRRDADYERAKYVMHRFLYDHQKN